MSRALRLALAEHLPPRVAGLEPLSALAERLGALEGEGQATRPEAHHLLLEGAFAALPALQRVVRSRAGVSAEVAEEIVSEVISRLGTLYDHWSGAGPFRAYLLRTLEREAWAVAQREQRLSQGHPEPHQVVVEVDAEPEPRLSPLQVQAIRRFAWFLYGSPDNPDRVRSDKALMDFLALSARLEGRPFAELVRDHQPRPGAWHQGRGEADCRWWRGRAQVAWRLVQEALKEPRYRAKYEEILGELARGGG